MVEVSCFVCGLKKMVKPYRARTQSNFFCGKVCFASIRKTILGDKTAAYSHGMCGTRFYIIYKSIKWRCDNPRQQSYYKYGGRGITYTWKRFEDFRDDMYESYIEHVEKYGEKETTIDRIDPNGNYCRENCRWATIKEQANNKNDTVYISYRDETKPISVWAEEFGIKRSALYRRIIIEGWPVERALTEPIRVWPSMR